MIWTSEEEMYNSLQEVVDLADKLKGKSENNQSSTRQEARSRDDEQETKGKDSDGDDDDDSDKTGNLPPGAAEDKKNHAAYVLNLKSPSFITLPRTGQRLHKHTPTCPKRKRFDIITEDSTKFLAKKVKEKKVAELTKDNSTKLEPVDPPKEVNHQARLDKSETDGTKSDEKAASLGQEKLREESKPGDRGEEDKGQPSTVARDATNNPDADIEVVDQGNEAQPPPAVSVEKESVEKSLDTSNEESITNESTDDGVPADSNIDESKKDRDESGTQFVETEGTLSSKLEKGNESGTDKEGEKSTDEAKASEDVRANDNKGIDGKVLQIADG
eukprot:CAMPEP_0197236628 /NCGR_PEP_ID=MMETSP1429-20130617/3678_1 /TAXON_ID=49237 /ORGANISM="Chaetoceros  sp., Strain UNC1202" /LENGTH=329 /DNA_ID=CAMNT_0042695453 /DNA_START=50 /DNA_END=1039 /DNA_ORIENTATION=+